MAPLVAAAAAALIAVAGTLAVTRAAAPDCARRIALNALPGAPAGARGAACLLSNGTIRVDAEGMPNPTDGGYEVWLLDSTSLDSPGALRMEALGWMAGTDEVFTPRRGIDLTRYNVVDISAEPADGNAAHSGRSLLRGRLPE